MISIIAAVITCIGTIAAAVVTTRRAGPAGAADPIDVTKAPYFADPTRVRDSTTAIQDALNDAATPARISKAFWLGLAGLAAWIIPLLAYVCVLPGLYIGIREQGGPRRLTAPGIAMCGVSLLLAVINSAVGAWQGAHGVGWWQQ